MKGQRILILTVVLLSATLAASLTLYDWSPEMLQQYIRSTARLSFAIFLIILTPARDRVPPLRAGKDSADDVAVLSDSGAA